MATSSCIFCRIIDGSETADEVYADEHVVAFLDVRPVFVGHVLVVPRLHHETLLDLPAESVAAYFSRVQMLAAAVPAAVGASGTFVAMNNVVSQSVPHLHTHVIPRSRGDGLRGFFWPRQKYRDAQHAHDAAEAIAAALDPGSL